MKSCRSAVHLTDPERVGAGKSATLCGLRVLADQAAETVTPYHSRADDGGWWLRRTQWCCLSQRAVRTMRVVMVDVLAQHRMQMTTPEDQHPVEQLPACRSYPALRISVGSRSPHRSLEHVDAGGGENGVEHRGELRVPIADQETEPVGPLAEVHQQIPGLLRHPLPYRMRRDAEHMDPAGGDLDGEQNLQPPQQHGIHGEEIHPQDAPRPGPEEMPPKQ